MSRIAKRVDLENHPVLAEERRREAFKELRKPFERKSILLQLILFGIVLLLWRVPIFNPIKLVVVLFHEFSHVAMAYATGGVVFGIAIDPGGAGVTLGMGGDEILIVAAGYMGSLLIGILLYLMTALWRPSEVWGFLTLVCCLTMAFGWLNSFTTFFGYGTITLMALGLFCLDDSLQKFFLRWIATTSCLYPVLDVAGEFLQDSPQGFMVQGRVAGSDVSQFSEMTGIPAEIVTAVWVVLGLATVSVLMVCTSKIDASEDLRASLFYKRRLIPLDDVEAGLEKSNSYPSYEIY